jgi:hypothetical protein
MSVSPTKPPLFVPSSPKLKRPFSPMNHPSLEERDAKRFKPNLEALRLKSVGGLFKENIEPEFKQAPPLKDKANLMCVETLDAAHFEPQKVKETARARVIDTLLKSNIFLADPSRDVKHESFAGQTVTQVQGNAGFCQLLTNAFYEEAESSNEQTPLLSFEFLRELPPFNSNALGFRYKRLGHALSLSGDIPLPDKRSCSLEGYNETFALPQIKESFRGFASTPELSHRKEIYHFVDSSLSKALWHDSATDAKIEETLLCIHNPLYHSPILVGSGWNWHSTQMIFFRDEKGVLYGFHINRGLQHGGYPGAVVLKINDEKKITKTFLKELTDRFASNIATYKTLARIKNELQAEQVDYIKMCPQKVGNCVYANLKAAVYILLILAQSTHNPMKQASSDGSLFAPEDQIPARQCYKKFSEYDATKALNDILTDIEQFDPKKQKTVTELEYAIGLNQVAMCLSSWANRRTAHVKIPKDLVQKASEILRDYTNRGICIKRPSVDESEESLSSTEVLDDYDTYSESSIDSDDDYEMLSDFSDD